MKKKIATTTTIIIIIIIIKAVLNSSISLTCNVITRITILWYYE